MIQSANPYAHAGSGSTDRTGAPCRVTHVITRLIIGGAQENTLATVLGLHQRPPFLVDLISGPTHGPEGSLEDQLQFQAHPPTLTIVPELVREVNPWKDILAWQALVRLFRRGSPHIVHTHSGKAGVVGRLAAAKVRIPIIVHTIHGPSFGPFQGRMANFVFGNAERIAGRYTDHFICVADAMKRSYLAAGIGRPEQFSRIFSGFPMEPFLEAKRDPHLRQQLGLGLHDIVVGKIARLFKLKGHFDLLEAIPSILSQAAGLNLKFLWVGDGTWKADLLARASKLGISDRIVLAGLVPPQDVPRFVAQMDLLVHLSLREGLPRALPQALAAGKPVVAYDCDGASEVCIDRVTGFLIRPGDRASLEGAILDLARNANLRQQLGSRGQRFVQEHFGVKTMLNQIEALYHRLIEAHRSA